MSSDNIYKLHQFDYLPHKYGIYAWYMYPNNESNIIDYYNIIISNDLLIHAKSSFKQEYYGYIYSTNKFNVSAIEPDMVKDVAIKFSPPVYIGIAKEQSLHTRLNQHKNSLIKLLNSPIFDSDDNSSFPKRLNNIIKHHNLNLDESNLFVKIHEVDKYQPEIIENTEYIINRIFSPMLGEK